MHILRLNEYKKKQYSKGEVLTKVQKMISSIIQEGGGLSMEDQL